MILGTPWQQILENPDMTMIYGNGTQQITCLQSQGERGNVLVREAQKKNTAQTEVEGKYRIYLVLLTVIEVPDHVFLRFIVINYHRLTMILELLVLRKLLIENLSLFSKIGHGCWNRHLSFRVASVRPIILISEISHSYPIIERVPLINTSFLFLQSVLLNAHPLLFFFLFLLNSFFFLYSILDVLLLFFLLFLVLEVEPVGAIEVGSVRLANKIIHGFEPYLKLGLLFDETLYQICALGFLDLVYFQVIHPFQMASFQSFGVDQSAEISLSMQVIFVLFFLDAKGIDRFERVSLSAYEIDALLLLLFDQLAKALFLFFVCRHIKEIFVYVGCW